MTNKPPPFKSLNIRIPTIFPIKGRGFINQGSGLGLRALRALENVHARPPGQQLDVGERDALGRLEGRPSHAI